MTSAINKAILRLSKRAESSDSENLMQTFVDVGPLFEILNGNDHQILYGRRSTGKTHVLNYLAKSKLQTGDAAVIIDLRNIGSNSGLYADSSVPSAERATRLLVDTLSAIHSSLLGFFIDRAEELDLSQSGPALDRLAEAINQVKVSGKIETTEFDSDTFASNKSSQVNAKASANPSVTVSSVDAENHEKSTFKTVYRAGHEHLYVNFGATSAAFRDVVSCLTTKRLWVLLDEWSSVPIALQPYLADLLRRSLFPINNVTVKIGAIEHRSSFVTWGQKGDYTGIEIGADASADVNLDDFMVFDNNAEKAQSFFRDLISQHIKAVARGSDIEGSIPSFSDEIMRVAFTEKRAIEEFVRSCEGVPRDAMNIISLAAQRANDDAISVNHIRIAANNWYERDKEKAVTSNQVAEQLLRWVVDQVIGKRRARAFLLRNDARDKVINQLYDSRVLHVLKRGISSHDEPGIRYDVYKLDYGCYVDLLSTSRGPAGLLPYDENMSGYIEVPPDDYRSIRRAILNLTDFYADASV